MITFSVDMPPLVYALGGMGLLAGVLRFYSTTRTYRNAITAATGTSGDTGADGQRLSVVAYGDADPDRVRAFLERMENQTYRNKQIIIVIDGTARQTASLKEMFSERFPDTVFSFVPPESKNLSRRKLANTIGIKAADGELILTTLTCVTPSSERWLELMVQQFKPEVDVVFGYASMDYEPMGPKASWRCFDSLTVAARWISAASCGRPYRGDGANLAFRRNTFFANSGYGNNYFLHSGDDDLFVTQITTNSNSTLMVHPDAQVMEHWGDSSDRVWIDRKEHYRFTARMLSRRPRLQVATGAVSVWAQWICWLAVAVLPLITLLSPVTNLSGLCIGVPLLASALTLEAVYYKRMSKVYGARSLGILQPLYALWQPLSNLIFSIRYGSRANKNFTYRR